MSNRLIHHLVESLVGIHVKVKDLPPVVQRALTKVGYKSRDITVKASTTFQAGSGGKGQRDFIVVIN
jgi:hypothetical protein